MEINKSLILVEKKQNASLFKFDYIYSTLSSKNKSL